MASKKYPKKPETQPVKNEAKAQGRRGRPPKGSPPPSETAGGENQNGEQMSASMGPQVSGEAVGSPPPGVSPGGSEAPATGSLGPVGKKQRAPGAGKMQPVKGELGPPLAQGGEPRESAPIPVLGWDRCFYCFSPAVVSQHAGRWCCERHQKLVLHPSGKVSVGPRGRRFASLHDLEVSEGWVKR
jgi:hypothetical protein